jgi:hypothetical protein
MIHNVRGGGGLGPGAPLVVSSCVAFAAMIAVPAPAAAQSPPYIADGIRWMGTAPACVAPPNWLAQRVFTGAQLPPALAQLCVYTWQPPLQPPQPLPTPADVAALFNTSLAIGLVEDVPVVFPSAFSPEEVQFFLGLRSALPAQVGTAGLLPSLPATPAVRIVVIDTTPDATAGHIRPGESRHGDTLAHLIEDIVCIPIKQGRRCAAEVTTALALPLVRAGVVGKRGGHIGRLSDLAGAIERAYETWQHDRSVAPSTTPAALLLNLSVGWEHTQQIADCTIGPLETLGLPARAVRGYLQKIAAHDVLVIAAAGNDSAGPNPRTGMVCPASYQDVGRDSDPSESLVVGVSGVDYQDRPLELTRPLGVTGIAALGLGGVAWDPADPVPPQLTGTSVSAAVASAIASLVWTYKPTWASRQVVNAVYFGGIDVGGAQQCPRSVSQCRSRRASVCGALHAAGASIACSIPPPRPWSCPSLPGQVAALNAAFGGGPPGASTPGAMDDLPRGHAPTVAVEPTTFPEPIAATCPTCFMSTAAGSTPPAFVLPALDQPLDGAVLVVRMSDGTVQALRLGNLLIGTRYVFSVPPGWIPQSAYLTGFATDGFSVTEQIFVQR